MRSVNIKSSQRNNVAVPALQKMVNILEELLKLRDPAHKVSNGKLIIEKLKQLQAAYYALDTDARAIINTHLQERNPGLFRALEKKGSKISKPFELAGELHDSLPEELKKLIASNPVLSAMQTIAIPSHELPEDESVIADTGTMLVNNGKDASNQLTDAIASAGRQLDPTVYAMFTVPDLDAHQSNDPLTAVIQALEILMKTRINKEKIQRGVPKPKGYDNAYRATLLKQFHALNNHKHVFTQVLQNPSNQEKITQIIDKLDKKEVQVVPVMLKLAGEISELIDDHLIDSLKSMRHVNTPRFL